MDKLSIIRTQTNGPIPYYHSSLTYSIFTISERDKMNTKQLLSNVKGEDAATTGSFYPSLFIYNDYTFNTYSGYILPPKLTYTFSFSCIYHPNINGYFIYFRSDILWHKKN